MNRTYKIFALSETITPCTHADRSEGNESLVARRIYQTPEGPRGIPHLSGNQIRHRLVREVGARFLIQRWGLEGKLNMRALNFLMHGGSLSESSANSNTRQNADMHRLMPLIRLVGGCKKNEIVRGSLIVWPGLLACRENAERLAAVSPAESKIPDAIRPAEDFVASYQYTRSDAAKSCIDILDPAETGEVESNLMIYSGQCVIPGAHFAHGFVLRNVSDLELGALLLSLRLWQAEGGTVGGMAAKGHGRLHTLISGDLPDDEESLVSAYVANMEANRDEGAKWLMEAFVATEEKAEKPKKAKAKKPDALFAGGAA
ncbi:MAG TPA: hypothetical protein VGM05_22100 [Planctomycetaceae bacterium]|jgi:hypothetical protein